MRKRQRRISPNEHFLILRGFVESMLSGLYGTLLARGVENDVAIDATDYVRSGLNNPLNNPFKPRKREPIEYRLGQEHWLTFASLLKSNDHILMGMLINSPYEWTVEEAYWEWKWLIAHLDPDSPRITAKKDKDKIARLQRVKAAWDSRVDVHITVEIEGYVAKTIILDQRYNNESKLVLAKRGLEQMAKGLNEHSFRKLEGTPDTT